MTSRGELLQQVMSETGTTQSELARLSGVRQPSISGFISGRVDLSDEMLRRLLSCMGYELEVTRRAVRYRLTRSAERSWRLHRLLARRLDSATFHGWLPAIATNLERLEGGVQGQPHLRNLERWRALIDDGDLLGMRRAMTGLDVDAIEMREVSPLGGLLPESERLAALAEAS